MIEISGLQKVVDRSTVLEIEVLTVGPGEVVALIEAAGGAKTALLELLTGRSLPTSGTVEVAGLHPVRDRGRLSRQVGVLFAENALYERLSTRANLAFHCQLRGLPPSRADEVLAEVGLADHATVTAGRLPSGLARRLAFGRAILHRSPVLLLAEPLRGCDANSRALLVRLIRERSRAGKAILILATEMAGLASLAPTIYQLQQGRLERIYAPLEARPAELPTRIPARLEDTVVLLNPADILYASTEQGQVRLHTAEGHFATHLTLAELEERLARSGFFRAHRGYLVNLQRVKAVIPYTRDSFTLTLDDPVASEIPLSKTAARELRDLLGY